MVYFISGLGADERVFQFLHLKGIPHRFIRWLGPLKGESMGNYCIRLLDQIKRDEEVVLIGISFGGIIAQELSKLISVRLVIIISSIKTHHEFSWPLKLVRWTQLHRMVPFWLMRLSNRYTANYFFGVKGRNESKLLHQIIIDTDPHFLVWAIHVLMNWRNENYPASLMHIHGTSDRIFPIGYIQQPIEIPSGGHFMIVTQSEAIEQLIFAKLNSLANENAAGYPNP